MASFSKDNVLLKRIIRRLPSSLVNAELPRAFETALGWIKTLQWVSHTKTTRGGSSAGLTSAVMFSPFYDGIEYKNAEQPCFLAEPSQSEPTSLYDSDSLVDNVSQDIDTGNSPLNWCAQLVHPDMKHALRTGTVSLLDSRAFIFPQSFAEDLDFWCAGENQKPFRRTTLACSPADDQKPYSPQSRPWTFHHFTCSPVGDRKSRSVQHRPWSFHHLSQPISRPCVQFSLSDVSLPPASVCVGESKQTPRLSGCLITPTQRRINSRVSSNKWGRYPPAGYI
ncbi:hypothetical protein K439DRAFT_866993 [Ramaria rubella]|nr:hypothetical protein K439DRAFT_866993 [Ramaria rubella]